MARQAHGDLAAPLARINCCNLAGLRRKTALWGCNPPALLLCPPWKCHSGVAVNAPLHFCSQVAAAQLIPQPAPEGLRWEG